jgi:hypothetical protein
MQRKKPCTKEAAKEADLEIDKLHSWADLYRWYRSYHQCDDGVMAEGFSEAVARQFVDHWETTPDLSHMAKRDPGFRQFVILHVNQTFDDKDLKKISENSAKRCPSGLNLLCRDLRKQGEAP